MPPFMILMISAVKTCFGSYDLRTAPGGLKHGFESRGLTALSIVESVRGNLLPLTNHCKVSHLWGPLSGNRPA